jgi:hypothetical protein
MQREKFCISHFCRAYTPKGVGCDLSLDPSDSYFKFEYSPRLVQENGEKMKRLVLMFRLDLVGKLRLTVSERSIWGPSPGLESMR